MDMADLVTVMSMFVSYGSSVGTGWTLATRWRRETDGRIMLLQSIKKEAQHTGTAVLLLVPVC